MLTQLKTAFLHEGIDITQLPLTMDSAYVSQLTFRTLFWSSEAILTAPLEESGGRAISSAYQLTELFVFLGSSS
jgi:hypothetical protein